jgi:hypothetical protein
VGLKRGPLSLVNNIEELLGRNSSDSGLESLEYGHRDPLVDKATPSIRKMLVLTSPTSGGPSVGVVLSRTQATVFFILIERPPSSREVPWSVWLNE